MRKDSTHGSSARLLKVDRDATTILVSRPREHHVVRMSNVRTYSTKHVSCYSYRAFSSKYASMYVDIKTCASSIHLTDLSHESLCYKTDRNV